MLLWEAVVLGIVQGMTEFLPISSSAHLTLLPQMLGWTSPLLNSLAFDVALHFGTLVAVLGYFRKDILVLASAWARGLAQGRPFAETEARLAWFIIAGTVPAVLVALFFEDALETIFRAPAVVAGWLIGAGVLLAAAERFSAKLKPMSGMTFLEALVIGTAQALALIPGVSRSGITITAGLAMGFRREDAARFSFLLALPAVAGACVMQFKDLAAVGSLQEMLAMILGVAASAVSGWAVIAGLLAYLRRRTLYVFAWYRLALGALVLIWVWRQA